MFGEVWTTGIPALIPRKYRAIWAQRSEKYPLIYKDFVVFCRLLPVIIIISTWSKEKSLWSDSLDLTSQPNMLESSRLKPNNPEYVLSVFLSCQMASYRPLVYIKFSPTTGRGAYCSSISERAFSNAETLFDGFRSTFCPFLSREIEARRA